MDNAVASVDEFGQHVASDGALCCFVGVDSGEEISITSNFHESTTQLQYDILIDGILRVPNAHSGTTARALHEVDNFSQFYAKQDSAMFEAVLKTKPLQQDIELQKGSRDTAGTIEFKIGTNSTTEREDTICFRHLTRWSLERAFLLTSVRTENGLESGRARPLVLAPWAVLRFFYRSKEAIARAEIAIDFTSTP